MYAHPTISRFRGFIKHDVIVQESTSKCEYGAILGLVWRPNMVDSNKFILFSFVHVLGTKSQKVRFRMDLFQRKK